MTVGQMMELYNLSQREQAHDHLMVGGFTLVDENGKKTSTRVRNLTPKDLASITGTLTNEQVKMAHAGKRQGCQRGQMAERTCKEHRDGR